MYFKSQLKRNLFAGLIFLTISYVYYLSIFSKRPLAKLSKLYSFQVDPFLNPNSNGPDFHILRLLSSMYGIVWPSAAPLYYHRERALNLLCGRTFSGLRGCRGHGTRCYLRLELRNGEEATNLSLWSWSLLLL